MKHHHPPSPDKTPTGRSHTLTQSGPIAFISFATRGEAQAALQGTHGLTIPGDGGKPEAQLEIQVSFSYKQSRQVRGDRVVTSNRLVVAGQQPANRHKVGVTGSNSSVDSVGQAADAAGGVVPQPVPNKAALNAGFFPVHSAQYLPGHPPPQLPGHMPLPQQVLPLQLPPQIPQQPQPQQQPQQHLVPQAQAQAQQHAAVPLHQQLHHMQPVQQLMPQQHPQQHPQQQQPQPILGAQQQQLAPHQIQQQQQQHQQQLQMQQQQQLQQQQQQQMQMQQAYGHAPPALELLGATAPHPAAAAAPGAGGKAYTTTFMSNMPQASVPAQEQGGTRMSTPEGGVGV